MSSQSRSPSPRRVCVVVYLVFKAEVRTSVHTEGELDILTAAAGLILEKSPGLLAGSPPSALSPATATVDQTNKGAQRAAENLTVPAPIQEPAEERSRSPLHCHQHFKPDQMQKTRGRSKSVPNFGR